MNRTELTFMPEFFDRYINLTDENTSLNQLLASTKYQFRNVENELHKLEDFRYEEGKWTPKELLQHVIDTERIMAYRALCIARGEKQSLNGFDEQEYANASFGSNRTIESLLIEFEVVRDASIILFESLDKSVLHNNGISNNLEITPLALGFVIVGHAMHHRNVFDKRYVGD